MDTTRTELDETTGDIAREAHQELLDRDDRPSEVPFPSNTPPKAGQDKPAPDKR